MKRIGFVAVAGLLWAGAAMAQDAAPPGCRWQNYAGDQILACKDGKGHWRRSGDDLVVGTYPLPKPKPPPAPKPVAAAAPAATAAAAPELPAGPVAATPADAAALPAASTSPAPVEAAAPSGDQKAVEPPAEPPKKPWWAAIWQAILDFLRMLGLLK